MALLKVGLFCEDIQEQLNDATRQASAIGIEATLLEGLEHDIKEKIKELRAELPSEELEVRETTTDVGYLQSTIEAYKTEARQLRHALATQRATQGELMQRISLRDTVLDALRTEALRKQEHSFSLELYDRIEAQLTDARAIFARELETAEKKHAATTERIERRLRSIIDAKEKEIIQLQLRFDQALRAAQGSHLADARSAAAELERLKADAVAALQRAQLETETRVLEAISKERVAAEMKLSEALSLKDAELKYLKTALDEQEKSNKLFDDQCRTLQVALDSKAAIISHLTEIELPYSVRAAVRRMQRRLESSAAEAAAAAQAAAEIINTSRAEIENLRNQLTAALKERDLLYQQISGLRSELVAKDAAIKDALQKQSALDDDDVEQLRNELKTQRAEMVLLRRVATQGGGASAEMVERMNELAAQLKEVQRAAERDSAASQKEIEHYARSLDAAQTKATEAVRELTTARRDMDELRNEIAALKLEIENLRAAKAKLESTVVSQRLHAAAAREASFRRTASISGSIAESPVGPFDGAQTPPTVDLPGESPIRRPHSSVTPTHHSAVISATTARSNSNRTPLQPGVSRRSPPPVPVSTVTKKSVSREAHDATREPPSLNRIGVASSESLPPAVGLAEPEEAEDRASLVKMALPSARLPSSPTQESGPTQRESGLAQRESGPAQLSSPSHRDASLQCQLPAANAVSQSTGRSFARMVVPRAEERLSNAVLRDELSVLRHVLDLQHSRDVDDFVERSPIPLGVEIKRQNIALENELRRRKALLALQQVNSAVDPRDEPQHHRDPIVDLLVAAARDAKLLRGGLTPDEDYVVPDLVSQEEPPLVKQPPRGERPPPISVPSGPSRVHIALVSPQGLIRRRCHSRPTSAGRLQRPESARSHCSAESKGPDDFFQIRTKDLVDPASYFSVSSKLRQMESLSARGAAKHAADEAGQAAAAEPEHGEPSSAPEEAAPTIAIRCYSSAPRPPVTARPSTATVNDIMRTRVRDARTPATHRVTWERSIPKKPNAM